MKKSFDIKELMERIDAVIIARDTYLLTPDKPGNKAENDYCEVYSDLREFITGRPL